VKASEEEAGLFRVNVSLSLAHSPSYTHTQTLCLRHAANVPMLCGSKLF